jgi:hypothetical protein
MVKDTTGIFCANLNKAGHNAGAAAMTASAVQFEHVKQVSAHQQQVSLLCVDVLS